ncbi:hypothetical protein BN946_scf184803.g37 [Trametes cinnabarina]|uniref:Poly [ADP-ribose] polymerase n=1 Tax=Pycnoporus cinnabarinus TaxID=5643 RepID=A0A060SC51_PYCCI|nr:hypothetical protein BN946_scf184803.g37 [Trametes cinnabarina]
MPPRKKLEAAAADASDGVSATTRTSGRTRAPSAKAVAVAAASAKPATASKATGSTGKVAAKGKGKKRAREESDEEDVADGATQNGEKDDAVAEDEAEEKEKEEKKPKSKRAKKNAGADADDDKDDGKGKGKAKDAATGGANGSKPTSKKTKDASDLPQKMVTVMKRGKVPVDPMSGLVNTHQVLETPEGVWDAMLNQTDIGKNANKFYVIQLLHPVGDNSQCTLYTRWGRVGENGQSQKKGPWSAATAVREFKKQFKAKAGVDWEHRVGMAPQKGKYVWLERSYEDEEEEDTSKKTDKKASSSKQEDEDSMIPESKLPPEIQTLCRLIFNTSLIDAHLSSMHYDANKLPLGKLAKSTILNGFSALKSLSEVISQPNGDVARNYGGFRRAVEELTGQYYSIIPHVFGRDRPIVIDNAATLKKELELVDALGDMEIASKLISSTTPKDASGRPVNPLDAHFRSLQLSKMEPVARSSGEFSALETYTRETHGATHQHYKVDVLNAFRVESLSDNTGLLLLCEVAAKPFYEQYQANYNAAEDCKKAGARSTKGLGRSQPNDWQDAGAALNNPELRGCHMPRGPARNVDDPNVYLQYNEYIVYDTSQIRLRYLLMVKMGAAAMPIVRRASTRIRKPSAKAVAVAAANAAMAAERTASSAKSKGIKRIRDESDDEREKKSPKSKRARKSPTQASASLKRASSGKTKDVTGTRRMDAVSKRSKIPIDPMSGLIKTHEVLVTEEGIWDAVLNQTNVGKNANKFYVLQILHPTGNKSECVLFRHWGRVGEKGEFKGETPCPPEMAIKQFKKRFRSKAGVPWEERMNMTQRIGGFRNQLVRWLLSRGNLIAIGSERSYDDDDVEEHKHTSRKNSRTHESLTAQSSKQDDDTGSLPDSALPPEVQRIAEVLAEPDGETARSHGGFQQATEALTGQYYSIIPHVFGRGRPIVINSVERLRTELELVDALGDMTVTSEVIASAIPKDEDGRPINPLDARFRMLQLSKMEPIPRSSTEFSALETYAHNTDLAGDSQRASGSQHYTTYTPTKVEVLHAFRVEREHETETWLKAGFDKLPDGDRLLLWHGSRTTNFAGILKQGLRIAPPQGRTVSNALPSPYSENRFSAAQLQ